MVRRWIGYSQNIKRTRQEQIEYEENLAASIEEGRELLESGEVTANFFIKSLCEKWEELFYYEEQLTKAEKAIQRFAWERYNWKRKLHQANAKIAKLQGKGFIPTDLILPKRKQSDFLLKND